MSVKNRLGKNSSGQKISCLFCQTKNDADVESCKNCGMALAKDHPESENTRQRFFVKAFWGIVIFCIVMMIYLPRHLF
jgi:predicted nucleic acid-binding Zn ribbon protein